MTGRPVLATPRSRGRTTETVLRGAPVAVGGSVILGQDASGRPIVLELAAVRPEWAEDLLQAVVEARRHASREVLP